MASSSSAWGLAGTSALRARTVSLAHDLRLDGVVLVAFLVSRVLLVIAAVAAETVIPHARDLETGGASPFLTSLTSWDGWWYLGIARDGYRVEAIAGGYHNTAFAPLYPLLIRVLATPWPELAAPIAVLLSNALFLAALGLLTTLGSVYLGRKTAARAAALLAIYPFASVFGMAYTESLFLLLMVGSYLAVERRHRALAGLLLALAVLTRLQGIALILPLGLLMLRQDGWRPKLSLGWLLLGVAAAAAFLLYVAALTGSATGYLDAMQAWGKSGPGSAPAEERILVGLSPYQGALLATLLISVFLLVYARVDRIPIEYVLLPVVFIAAVLSSGSLESVGRYTMLAFPYTWILANRSSWLSRGAWPVVSAVLFAIVAILSFAQYWVP